MLEYALVILIGLAGGAAVGIQSPIAGAMGQRVGAAAGSLIIHLSGAILSAIFLFLRGGEKIQDWYRLPWYMLISGIFGLLLYQSITYTMPRLGGAMMVTLIMVGQLLVGLTVDHFGWLGAQLHPISMTRIFGAAALLLGGYLISR